MLSREISIVPVPTSLEALEQYNAYKKALEKALVELNQSISAYSEATVINTASSAWLFYRGDGITPNYVRLIGSISDGLLLYNFTKIIKHPTFRMPFFENNQRLHTILKNINAEKNRQLLVSLSTSIRTLEDCKFLAIYLSKLDPSKIDFDYHLRNHELHLIGTQPEVKKEYVRIFQELKKSIILDGLPNQVKFLLKETSEFQRLLKNKEEKEALRFWKTHEAVRVLYKGQTIRVTSTHEPTDMKVNSASLIRVLVDLFALPSLRREFFGNNQTFSLVASRFSFDDKVTFLKALIPSIVTPEEIAFLSRFISKFGTTSELIMKVMSEVTMPSDTRQMLEKYLSMMNLSSALINQIQGKTSLPVTNTNYIDLTEDDIINSASIPETAPLQVTPPSSTETDMVIDQSSSTNDSSQNDIAEFEENTDEAEADNSVNSPAVSGSDIIIEELRNELNQVIFKRLNSLVKKSKAEQYKPFAKQASKYIGQFALPLPKEDIVELMFLIDLYSKQLSQYGAAANERFSQFVLNFFKTYKIYFYTVYDENGLYSDLNRQPFHFTLNNNLDLQQRIITQNIAMHQEMELVPNNMSKANSDLVTNTLLFNQVDYLSKNIIDGSEAATELFVIINPPSGLGKHSHHYTADLVLVDKDSNGFSAFYEVSKLEQDSAPYQTAMDLAKNLNLNLQDNLLLDENTVKTHTFSTTKELKKFLQLINKNNEDENFSLLTPLIGMAPIKKKAGKKKKAVQEDGIQKTKLTNVKSTVVKLAERKLFKETLRKKIAKPETESNKSSNSTEKEETTRSFEDFLNKKLRSFYHGASRPLRFIKKIPDSYLPTRKLVEYKISDTLGATIQEIAKAKGINYFPYQLKGVELCAKKRRVLLADEMGLGKTLQGITLVMDRLKHTPPGKTALLLVPKSVLRNWEKHLLEIGIEANQIGIFMGTEGLSKKVSFNYVRNKRVILASLGTFQARLSDPHDNAIKQLCGYLPRVSKQMSDKLTYEEIQTLYTQISTDTLFSRSGLVGKEYVSQDNKNIILNFFNRMPNQDEFLKLSTVVKSAKYLQRAISWEIIWHHLIKQGFINSLGALLVTKKSLADNLQKLYAKQAEFCQSHGSLPLTITINEAMDFINKRISDFSIDDLLVDEAHRATFPSLGFHRVQPIAHRLQKNDSQIVLLTGTPGKNRFTEVYSLHALLDDAYTDPALFTRAFKRDKLAVQKIIFSLLSLNSQENREAFSQEMNKINDCFVKLVERQKQARVRRTFEETKEDNKIPRPNPVDNKYSMSERENEYLSKHQAKIDKVCRNYDPTSKISKKKENDLVNSDKVNLFTLQKFFSHPILKTKKYGSILFGDNPNLFIPTIEKYILEKCNNDFNTFIAQSSRLSAICDIVAKHPNEKFLIDVKFLPFAHIIQYVLQKKLGVKVGVFSGQLNSNERDKFETDFNEKNAFSVACVTKAGGEGIKLYAKHVVLEQNWCVANRRQLEARARRTGSPFEEVDIHDLFSLNNPLDMKYRSFNAHKDSNEQYFFEHNTVDSKKDLLNIIIDEMLKDILDPKLRAKVEAIRPKLHELISIPAQFNLLDSLQYNPVVKVNVRKWNEFAQANPDVFAEIPEAKSPKGKEPYYEEEFVDEFEEELMSGSVMPGLTSSWR